MTDQLRDAATIAVVGVAVVMVALIILMIAIMIMTRLFPGKKDHGEKEMSQVAHSHDKEQAAAIAVVMALAMERKEEASACTGAESVGPGHGISRWASAGRERLMHSRTKLGRERGRTSR